MAKWRPACLLSYPDMLSYLAAVFKPSGREPDDFVSVARRLECYEDKKRFEAKLGKIAKHRPGEKRG
jgi:hypothetical protein